MGALGMDSRPFPAPLPHSNPVPFPSRPVSRLRATKNPTVLDIWMLVCISFVWIALLAYAILLMGQRTRAWTNETNVVTLVTPNSGKTKVAENLNRRQFSSINLDKIYLISLPIIFCLFNLIYWPIIYIYRF